MKNDAVQRHVIDITEVGRILGISKNAAYAAAARNEIPGLFRLGRRILIRRAIFESWLRGEATPPAANN